jgi:transcriptional regulator with XRE-family HTH domain
MDTGWLRTQLEERNLTQADVARALGRDPSAISRLMKGDRALGLNEAKTLALLLGVDIETVMAEGPPAGTTKPARRAAANEMEIFSKQTLKILAQLSQQDVEDALSPVSDSSVKARLKQGLKALRSDLAAGVLDSDIDSSSHSIPLYGRSNYRSNYIVREDGAVQFVPRPPELLGVDAAYAADVISEEMAPRYFPGERIYVAPNLVRTHHAFVMVWYKAELGEVGRILRLGEFDEANANFYTLHPEKSDVILPHSDIVAIHRIVGCFS